MMVSCSRVNSTCMYGPGAALCNVCAACLSSHMEEGTRPCTRAQRKKGEEMERLTDVFNEKKEMCGVFLLPPFLLTHTMKNRRIRI